MAWPCKQTSRGPIKERLPKQALLAKVKKVKGKSLWTTANTLAGLHWRSRMESLGASSKRNVGNGDRTLMYCDSILSCCPSNHHEHERVSKVETSDIVLKTGLKTIFLRYWSWPKQSWFWPWTVLKIWKIAVLRPKIS